MRKTIIIGLAVLTVALTGCSKEGEDRKNGSGKNADRILDVDTAVVYRNIDNFPNIEMVCAGGIAFAATRTTSDSGEARAANLLRVPEWDARCGPAR